MNTMKDITLNEIKRLDKRVVAHMNTVFALLPDLSDSDYMNMLTLALAYDDVFKSYDTIALEGPTKLSHGQPISHPCYKIIAQAFKQINVVNKEYGLTKYSDKSMKIAEKKISSSSEDESPLLNLLKNDNTEV